MKPLKSLFILLLLTDVVQSIYFYPVLPAEVASHFDGQGSPNGWSSKATFFTIYLAVLALQAIIFLLVPDRLVQRSTLRLKLPDPDYWLAPQRRERTLTLLRTWLLVFGSANVLLVIITVQLVIRANAAAEPRLEQAMFPVLGGYFAFVAVWLLVLVLAFKRIRHG